MPDLDKLKASIAAWLAPLQRQIDYSAFYEANVVMQNADGSLELEPLTPKLAPLSKVAIRYGVPGVTVKVKSGGLALVGFANASPRKPFALVMDAASIESLSLFGGERPIACMGDGVRVSFPPTAPVTGLINGTTPFAGTVTFVTQAVGQIITGRKNVTA